MTIGIRNRRHQGLVQSDRRQGPGADALTDGVIAAKNYDQLVAWSRALDRVLLWSHC